MSERPRFERSEKPDIDRLADTVRGAIDHAARLRDERCIYDAEFTSVEKERLARHSVLDELVALARAKEAVETTLAVAWEELADECRRRAAAEARVAELEVKLDRLANVESIWELLQDRDRLTKRVAELEAALQDCQGIALNGTDAARTPEERLDAIDARVTAALAGDGGGA